MRRALSYAGGLIALYVVVTNAGNVSSVLAKGSAGLSTVVGVFQGRPQPPAAPQGRMPR